MEKCVHVNTVIPDLVILTRFTDEHGHYYCQRFYCLQTVEFGCDDLVDAFAEKDLCSQDIEFVTSAVPVYELDNAVEGFGVGIGDRVGHEIEV